MLRGSILMPLGLAALLSIGLTNVSARAQASKKPQISEATLSIDTARAIALKLVPGEIMKEELERERGGTGLRYSFDIRQGKKWREVGVDAKTGRILENSAEAANPKD